MTTATRNHIREIDWTAPIADIADELELIYWETHPKGEAEDALLWVERQMKGQV
mgnify:CR=1 FL=1